MMARSSWAPEKRSVKKRVPKVSVILKNYIVNVSNPKSPASRSCYYFHFPNNRFHRSLSIRPGFKELESAFCLKNTPWMFILTDILSLNF